MCDSFRKQIACSRGKRSTGEKASLLKSPATTSARTRASPPAVLVGGACSRWVREANLRLFHCHVIISQPLRQLVVKLLNGATGVDTGTGPRAPRVSGDIHDKKEKGEEPKTIGSDSITPTHKVPRNLPKRWVDKAPESRLAFSCQCRIHLDSNTNHRSSKGGDEGAAS